MSRRRRRAGLILAVFAALCAATAANLWALRTPLRFDFTQRGVFSIGPETERVLASLDRPVRVTFFYDLRNQVHLDALALLRRYAQASPWVSVRAYDPDLQPGVARSMGVRFAGETVFEAEGKMVIARGGSEEDFTNGLLRATSGAAREICFSEGHGESDPESFASHDHFETQDDAGHQHSPSGGDPHRVVERHGLGVARESLETLGYEVSKRATATGPTPLVGCAVVVVASPTTSFEPAEVERLRAFLARGGSVLLMLEPGAKHRLDRLLGDYGVRWRDGAVRDPRHHYWTDPGTPAVSRYPRHRVTRGLAMTFFPGVSSFEPAATGLPDDVVAVPLLETSERAHAAGAPEEDGTRVLMVYAVRKTRRGDPDETTSRLAVIGDGDFATNSFFSVLGNRDLFLNTVHTLAEVERLIGIAPRSYAAPRLELSASQLRRSFVISTLLMPGLALAAGGWMWRRRRV